MDDFVMCVLTMLIVILASMSVNTMRTPDVGKTEYANQLLTYYGSGLKIALYTAIAGGADNTKVYANFTKPTFMGYADVTLANPVLGTLIAADQQPVSFDPVAFQPTGSGSLPQTAIGLFIFNPTGNILIHFQPFTTGFVFSSTSSNCTFTPAIGTGQIDPVV